ncbi:hypothetical protein VTN96DRAFT_4098 [Rasamsonia emersonii]
MAEEPRPQSIQERIAALKQSQVGRIPNGASSVPVAPSLPPRPAASTAKSINNPPHEVNGSVVNSKSVGNRQNGGLSPPTITKTSPDATEANRSKPPPLPARRTPSQPRPPLPPRSPSVGLQRRPSSESTTSSTSFSTSSTSGTAKTADTRATSVETGTHPLRAPAWGETELPPLPPRNSGETKEPSSTETLRKSALPPMPLIKPPLPSRNPSNESREINRPPPPLPRRQPSTDQVKQLPIRSGDQSTKGAGGGQAVRKLPPVPSADDINKIRQSSFAGLSKPVEKNESPATLSNGHNQNHIASDAPPPVPLATRPDLSALQATKPKFKPNKPPSLLHSSTECLKCRDFSGPDTHAARFPRQSLPSNDLAWLANQLTAPFPSPTDKARAIFTWLHYNIKYDVDSFFNHCVQPSTPERTLATGLAVCEGYAGLFKTLATHAGLEALVISGHGKGYGHVQLAPGSPIPPFESNHAWNVVKIDGGQWKLIDACWGAGAVQGKGKPYIHRFDPTNFTKSNDEFGLTHFPANKNHFYRDDGRPEISWEEYILSDPDKPFGIEQPVVFGPAKEENGISDRSFLPATRRISVHQPGPIRFQFSLICEHWTLTRHSKKSAPYLFLLMIHGIDGRQDDRIPFNHVPGSGPNGGGDFWYVDIADPRTLGAPGQKLAIAAVTSFGSRQDARGLSLQEYRENVGRVGMAWSYMAEWELV